VNVAVSSTSTLTETGDDSDARLLACPAGLVYAYGNLVIPLPTASPRTPSSATPAWERESGALTRGNGLFWLEALALRASSPRFVDHHRPRDRSRWQPPRQGVADAMEQAAGMVDRFNRIFLRTLRTLRALRRQGGPVIFQAGGQMNVAHQQVNLAPPAPPLEAAGVDSGS
jgi:hypothetical protein